MFKRVIALYQSSKDKLSNLNNLNKTLSFNSNNNKIQPIINQNYNNIINSNYNKQVNLEKINIFKKVPSNIIEDDYDKVFYMLNMTHSKEDIINESDYYDGLYILESLKKMEDHKVFGFMEIDKETNLITFNFNFNFNAITTHKGFTHNIPGIDNNNYNDYVKIQTYKGINMADLLYKRQFKDLSEFYKCYKLDKGINNGYDFLKGQEGPIEDYKEFIYKNAEALNKAGKVVNISLYKDSLKYVTFLAGKRHGFNYYWYMLECKESGTNISGCYDEDYINYGYSLPKETKKLLEKFLD